MRVLVTGSDGFIGRHIRDDLRQRGYDVFGTTYFSAPADGECTFDITSESSFRDLPTGSFDAVVHTIGVVDQRAPGRQMRAVNATGTKRLIEWAKTRRCNHFLQMSSVAVYGRRALGVGITEETPRARFMPLAPYVGSKARAEAYVEEGGVDYTILRLPAVIGAGDTFATPAIVDQILGGGVPRAGLQSKPFSTLFVRNLAGVVRKLLDVGPLQDAFNCTDYAPLWFDFVGEVASCLKLTLEWRDTPQMSLLAHLRDKPFLFLYGNSRFGAHYPNTKLFARIDYNPEFSWQAGVKEAVESRL